MQYWEAWQPEVGQRVRVRLSGECPFMRCLHDTPGLDGSEGDVESITVMAGRDGITFKGHRVYVRFIPAIPYPDDGSAGPQRRLWGTTFAVNELEPVP